jgi:putative ABC transport system ATP-binding protein
MLHQINLHFNRQSNPRYNHLIIRHLNLLIILQNNHFVDHHPNQLSGGQQQRVAIARALVNQPALLLADEPTGNLDSKTSVEIMEVFQTLNEQGITIVMVTHEHDIAQYNKRCIVMRDGVVRSDSPVVDRLDAKTQHAALENA